MQFAEEQAVRSIATKAEGTVLRSIELVMVKMASNGEIVTMDAKQLEEIPPPDLPSPPLAAALPSAIDAGHQVICINKWWCTGQVGQVKERVGGKVYIEWDKSHWNYYGQFDGFYPVDNFQHYHPSVMSDAA